MPKVRDVMTRNPITLSQDTNIVEAAKCMSEKDIGDVVVTNGGGLCGIVTDRDIVVRAIAQSRDPASTRLGDVCTKQLVTVRSDDEVEVAIDLMRKHAIRRLPVVDDGRAVVGIVSLGDLAAARDPHSVLGEVSQAPPQH